MHGKKKSSGYPPYADANWGAKTRNFVRSTQKLDEVKWELVKQAAAAYAGPGMGDEAEEDAEEGANDPRACIEVWYVDYCPFMLKFKC